MNLFKDLRENYGRNAVRDLRSLENTERKISRFRCHRVYSLRAKHSGLIPTSLKLKCPINTKRARDIVNKAEKALLNERIRVVTNKIKTLEDEKIRANANLNAHNINKDLSREISRHVENSRESEFQHVRARQTRKLKELAVKQEKSTTNNVNKNNSDAKLDLSGTQLKRWVKNLSKYKLSDAQNSVLARGLGYAVSPDNLNQSSIVDDHIVACEKACWKLTKPEAAQLRAEIVGTLKSAKVPPSNISKDERTAIKQLQKEESIMVLRADKGRATVVMDKSASQEKCAPSLATPRHMKN
ncbi:uncharacterized protein [Amphiura filiformis]|uniref:uncharacterized protein n=1 Tax=Amphiura filiformis TaxID=82378 RepID=UPI003B228B33